ncbi:MAG TPA: copper resistance protein CopC, partial [Devosia sp.]
MTACLRLVLLVILAAFTPSVVLAHAQLLSTEPADSAVLEMAPKTLTLRFNEPVSPLRFTLVGPDGIAVAVEASGGTDIAVQLPPALATGTHLLSWRVVSIDGHPIGGSLVFSIGRATGSAAAE